MNIHTIKYLSKVDVSCIEREFYIGHDTGKTKVIYSYSGQLVSSVKLTGGLVNRASALALIMRDLDSSRKWYRKAASILKDNGILDKKYNNDSEFSYYQVNDANVADEVRGLFIASMTFYGKAFTTADGRKLKAERNWLDEEHVSIHDTMLDIRHNFAAHSGRSEYESSETYLLLIPQGRKNIIYFPTTIRQQMNMIIDSENVDIYLSHLDYVFSVVDNKYRELLILITESAMSKSRMYWECAAKSNEPITLDVIRKRK
ncbi:Uncharacterised protein [Serratia quinivorans]|nr:Uncharacterised protein [Serratia quinivorans]